MGRPTKFNDARMNAIVTALKNGSTRRDAAAAAGVHYETLLNWQKEGEEKKEGEFFEFFDAVTRAEAECANKMAKALSGAATKDWRAAESWLKRRRKEDWSERAEITGPNGGPQEVDDVTNLTPEQRVSRTVALLDAARARRDFDSLARDGGPEQLDA